MPERSTTRAQLRAYLGGTLAGKRQGWGHLALKHNSIAITTPCRPLAEAAHPAEGPALFWDGDPLCPSCAAEVAPELALYLAVLHRLIQAHGGDWRALGKRAS